MDLEKIKYLVVGAGLSGSVIAERIANDLGERVVVLDKRGHPGGNCYSKSDPKTNIHYHLYGTHIFHTNNKTTWDYVSKFTKFNTYRHQVLTTYKNVVYQMPINLETINSFYRVNLRPFEVKDFLQQKISLDWDSSLIPKNFEEKAISLIGKDLYMAFIYGYSKKQWQCDPKTLPAEILTRLPFRLNYEESYYNDEFQGIPVDGYTKIFERMLDHPLIELKLETDYFAIRNQLSPDCHLFYSGPIDQFFDFIYGKLEWRGLNFTLEHHDVDDYQGTSVMNYADLEIPYTRIHEPHHLHPEKKKIQNQTLTIKEFSISETSEKNPYYPINNQRNSELLKQYQALSKSEKYKNVTLLGRLGDYRYYDMNHAIERSHEIYQKFKEINLIKLR